MARTSMMIASMFGGKSSGSVDFGGGAILGGKLFVAKFDPSGNHLASAGFGTGLNVSHNTGVAVDPFNNIAVISSNFDGTLDLGGGVLPTFGNSDVSVGKLTPTFGHLWSWAF